MRSALLVSLSLVVALTTVARADRTYHYVFDREVYSGNPGGTVDVQVSLEERKLPSDTSLLYTEGLVGAGVRLSYVNPQPNPPTEPAWVADPSAITHNPQFNDLPPAKYMPIDWLPVSEAFPDDEPGAADVIAALNQWIPPDATSGALAEEITAGEVYRIRLGTFRFTLGNILGETTAIRASDLFAGVMDDTETYNFTVLDALIASAEATLVTAPEPASWVLLGAGTVLAGVLVRRRRQGR